MRQIVFVLAVLLAIASSASAQETATPDPRVGTLEIQVAQLEAKLAEANKAKATPEQQAEQQLATLTAVFQNARQSPAAKACRKAKGQSTVVIIGGTLHVGCAWRR